MENKENLNNVHFISMAKTERPVFLEQTNKNWVKCGEDNNLFENLIEYSQNYSATHTSILNTKISAVKGSKWVVENGPEDLQPNDTETFIEIAEKCSGDLEVLGAFALEIIWSVGKTIKEINHIPLQYLRYQEVNDSNKITGMHYSRKWNSRKAAPVFIPFFDPKKPSGRQVLLVKKYWPGSPYTIIPSYYSAINYIKVDEKVSNFHLSNITNGLNPSLVISLNNGVPDPTTQDRIVQDIQNSYSDTDNAGKMMLFFSESKDKEPTITQLEGNQMGEMFLLLSESVAQQLLTAHQLTNPLLAGIKVPGSLAGSTEILQAYELFNKNVIRPDQNMLIEAFNKLLAFNGHSIKIINNSVIQFGFSENLLLNVLTKNELREIVGYDEIADGLINNTEIKDKE